MRYYVFESGSKGNCTLICSKGKYLVVDNGLSKRKFKAYLANVNVSFEDIRAVLLTHSHTDHIAGVSIFDEYAVYSSKETYPVDDQHVLVPYSIYYINDFKVTVIPTSHDAKGSIGFIIEDDEEKLVYITDTGYVYEKVLDYIKDADYYIFESNHDVRMQLLTGRPQYLIDRIMGDHGHLSNEDASLYLSEIISSRTKEIVLAHLSLEANTPELALKAFYKIMAKRGVNVENINVRTASQNEMLSGGDVLKELCHD